MSAGHEHSAAAVGLVRLVLLDQSDAARHLVEHLTDGERQAVADVLERVVGAVASTILGMVRHIGHVDPVRAAEAVADLLDASARLDGIDERDLDRLLLERVDRCIVAALGLEPASGA